jgi:hypothetical protein
MKKSAKAIVLSVFGFVALLFLLIIRDTARNSSTNRYIGFAEQIEQTNPIPDEWQQVKDRWSNGDFLEAINKSLYASRVIMDFGVRTIISQFYFRQSAILESQGQFKQAFDTCFTGAQFIFKYDTRDYVMGAWCVPVALEHNIPPIPPYLSTPKVPPTLKP